MNLVRLWHAIRLPRFGENFVSGFLNRGIEFLPYLAGIMRRLVDAERSLEGWQRQQRENADCKINRDDQIAPFVTTAKGPDRNCQARKKDNWVQPLNRLCGVIKDPVFCIHKRVIGPAGPVLNFCCRFSRGWRMV